MICDRCGRAMLRGYVPLMKPKLRICRRASCRHAYYKHGDFA